MMVKPSDHISFGKFFEMRANPYPVTPSADRRARSFWSLGRANKRRVWNSTSFMRCMGMPWLVTWKTPHFSHARRTREAAFESNRSMTGTQTKDGVL